MKTFMTKKIVAITALSLALTAFAQDEEPVVEAVPPQNGDTESNAELSTEQQQAVGELIQAVVEAQQNASGENRDDANGTNQPQTRAPRPIRGQGTRGTMGSTTNAVSLTAFVAKQSTNHVASNTNLLRLNFRNAPLSMVLDYLSEAAGFTISPNSKVDLKGTITVWSNQPVTREQAVALLHKALAEHHYGATVEGNILNIFVVDSSNTEIVSGVPENDYTKIPPTQELVTQIVYVHNVEANQLISSLQPLMPSGTSMTANQGANAIVITDTKANIRRMVQLVKALDTSSVSASTVRVFPLIYADATAMAQVVQQLFQGDASSQSSRSRFPFGGFPFGGGDRDRSSSSTAATAQGRVAAAKVVAAADDRSNSLVVSASEDQMAEVERLVNQMDVNVDDVTELRVFRLRYADPQETADQIAALFPDPTAQQNSQSRFSRGFFGAFDRNRSSSANTGNNSQNNSSSRTVREARVTAVPDPRTSSIIVSASHDMMNQIAGIVEELDSDPAKKKKVYVIRVENRDPQEVVEDLQSVIAPDQTAGNLNTTRNNARSSSQLNSRQQNNLQNSGNYNNNNFLNNSGRTRIGQ